MHCHFFPWQIKANRCFDMRIKARSQQTWRLSHHAEAAQQIVQNKKLPKILHVATEPLWISQREDFKVQSYWNLWTHFERKISSYGDLGTEMKVAMGVADSEHGVAGCQGFGSHPTAVVVAWSQPLWIRTEGSRGGSRKKGENAIWQPTNKHSSSHGWTHLSSRLNYR